VNTYLAGNLIRVASYSGLVTSPTGGFRDATGTLADPSVVTLKYRPGPGAALVTVTYPASPIVRDGAGLYHADLDTSAAIVTATWTYEWSGTGTVQALAASAFGVTIPYL
jgi:hypothetical protein